MSAPSRQDECRLALSRQGEQGDGIIGDRGDGVIVEQ